MIVCILYRVSPHSSSFVFRAFEDERGQKVIFLILSFDFLKIQPLQAIYQLNAFDLPRHFEKSTSILRASSRFHPQKKNRLVMRFSFSLLFVSLTFQLALEFHIVFYILFLCQFRYYSVCNKELTGNSKTHKFSFFTFY